MEKFHCVMATIPPFGGLKKLQRQIPDEAIYDNPGFGRVLDPHVTILYGLHNENDYFAVRRMLQEVRSIPVELGEISKFTSEKYDVIKVDILSDVCERLHNKIKETCENTQTHDGYKPHLTLAYVTPGSCDHLLGNKSLEGEVFNVKECIFSLADDSMEIPIPVGKHGNKI